MEDKSQIELDRLKKNVGQLIAKLETSESNEKQLAAELLESEENLAITKNKLEDLQKQIENLQLAEAFRASSGNTQEAKAKIGKLIREIDKCIALLNDDGRGREA
ncbi:MAG: hypothetical protein QMB59_05160 [Bacteroidales bacterium]|jgi:chromosome segregation ATPase